MDIHAWKTWLSGFRLSVADVQIPILFLALFFIYTILPSYTPEADNNPDSPASAGLSVEERFGFAVVRHAGYVRLEVNDRDDGEDTKTAKHTEDAKDIKVIKDAKDNKDVEDAEGPLSSSLANQAAWQSA